RESLVLLDVELTGMKEPGPVHLIARMLDEKGQEEKRFERDIIVNTKDRATIKSAWKWHNPRLWDLGQPNLYTCVVQVKGLGIYDEYTQSFGFREFWIEGRKFFLNGKEFRPHPAMDVGQSSDTTAEVLAGQFDSLLKAGFNIEDLGSIPLNQRGIPNDRYFRADIADRQGWPLVGGAVPVREFMVDSNSRLIWEDSDNKKKWEAATLADLKKMRNHPSILMWSLDANFFGFSQDQNPVLLGQRDWTPADPWAAKTCDFGREAIGILQKCDSTRPIFSHQGGFVGDLQSLNTTLCLAPLQEHEEWPSHWAQKGLTPFIPIELGILQHGTFMRGRAALHQTAQTEPLVTEFSAIYLGNEAYRIEPQAYRNDLKHKFLSDQSYTSWQGNSSIESSPALQKIESLFVTNTWRSWRTWGVTPGLPTGTALSPALRTSNAPTLAWIAGPKDAFTAKDHTFTPGQTVHKQAILINDSRDRLEYSCKWSATLDGKPLVSASTVGTLSPTQTLASPIEFNLPEELSLAKVDGEIHLQATLGSETHEDHFAFRVLAKAEPSESQLAIFDPPGMTAKMLEQQGYKLTPWKGQLEAPVVVIGREVLSRGLKLSGDLDAYVREGGRALVFTQHPDWIRSALGLRVAQHLPRRVFPVSAQHPVVAGLDPLDLRDWAGESTLIEAWPDATKTDMKLGAHEVPYYGWHWGNRGAVSSAAIEKPHRAGWRPILECEFDLAYTPLMELDYGKGRLVWCTLDLEDHVGSDPAAAKLLHQLVTYAANAPLQPRSRRTILIGSDLDASQLDALGVEYRRENDLDPSADLVIAGAEASIDRTALEAYIRAGGKVFFLPTRKPASHLGATLVRADSFGGSLEIPDWPECEGLSPSDLRWRTDSAAWLIQSPGQVGAKGLLSRVTMGSGVAIFCQIDPNSLNADQQTYFRYTRWRQTRAMSQVLANMGATFALDRRFLQPKSKDEARPIELDDRWRARMVVTFPPVTAPGRVLEDPGMSEEAKALIKPDLDHSQWQQIKMPTFYRPLSSGDGEAVFRKSVQLPKSMANKELVLSLGAIDDFDDVFVNGVRVGGIDRKNPTAFSTPRVYIIPGNLMKEGRNIIAVRVWDGQGKGGFAGPAKAMFLRPKNWKPSAGFYHGDYRDDFELGDDPYRYYRW
ncbi:MAG: hypothetical protein ACM359_12220, partial [Bacillota bacterium]